MTNLLLIDDRVRDYEKITHAANESTRVVVIDYRRDTIDIIQKNIQKLNIGTITNVAYVAHGHNNTKFKLVHDMEPCVLRYIKQETLISWTPIINFMKWLKETYNTSNFDFVGCRLGALDSWKMVFEYIEHETDLNVRASDNDSGNIKVGGDWILETDNVNIKTLYFTDEINKFIHLLYIRYYNDSPYTYTVQSLVGCNLNTLGGPEQGGVLFTNNQIEVSQTVNDGSSRIILDTSGSVHFYGNQSYEYDGVEYISRRTPYTKVLIEGSLENYDVTPNLTMDVSGIYSNDSSYCALKADGTVVVWGNYEYGGSLVITDSGEGIVYTDLTSRINSPGSIVSVHTARDFGGYIVVYADNHVDAWGYNSSGGFGFATTAQLALVNSIIENNPVIDIKFCEDEVAVIRRFNGQITTIGPDYYNVMLVDNVMHGNYSIFTALNGSLPAILVDPETSEPYLNTEGEVYSVDYAVNDGACAAVMSDGTIISWGNYYDGGNFSTHPEHEHARNLHTIYNTAPYGGPFNRIYACNEAFCALNLSGFVIAFGDEYDGGRLISHTYDSETFSFNEVNLVQIVGEETIVPGNIVNIIPSYEAFAALKADGTVITWGEPEYCAPYRWDPSGNGVDISSELVNITTIVATRYAYAAINSSNILVTWGGYDQSHFHRDGGYYRAEPLTNVRKIYAIENGFAAITQETTPLGEDDYDGTLHIWGDRDEGAYNTCGAPISSGVKRVILNQRSFLPFYDIEDFIVQKTDGTFYMLGDPYYAVYPYVNPERIQNVVKVVANQSAFCALNVSGIVQPWGNVYYGGAFSSYGRVDPVPEIPNITDIVASRNAFAAVNNSGTVMSWGNYDSDNEADEPEHAADFEQLESGVTRIFATGYAFHALKTDGTVFSWGNDESAYYLTEDNQKIRQARYNDEISEWVSITSELTNVKHIYTVNDACAALKNDGSVVCWGDGRESKYETYYNDENINVSSHLTSGVIDIVGNYGSFAALKDDGSVIVWGDSYYGGTLMSDYYDFSGNYFYNNPTGSDTYYIPANASNPVVKLVSSYRSYAAIRRNGELVLWGSLAGFTTNDFVEGTLVPRQLTEEERSNVAKVLLTEYMGVILRRDGSVSVFGDPNYGGAKVGYSYDTDSLSNDVSGALSGGVMDIFVSDYACCALRSNGTVVAWGGGYGPEYGGGFKNTFVNSNIVRVIPLNNGFLVVYNDGSISGWGDSYMVSPELHASISGEIVDIARGEYATCVLTRSDDYSTFTTTTPPTNNLDKLRLFRIVSNRAIFENDGFYAIGDRTYNINMYEGESYVVLKPVNEDMYSYLLALDAGVNWYIPINNGEEILINGITYTSFDNLVYAVSESTYTRVDSITIGERTFSVYGGSILGNIPSGGSGGGDPHIKTIYNDQFLLPNKVAPFILYNDSINNVKVIGFADHLPDHVFNQMHTVKGSRVVQISNAFKKMIKSYTYFTKVIIEHNSKQLIYDSLTNKFYNNTEFIVNYSNQSKKGLYSIFHKKFYQPSPLMQVFKINIGKNKLTIKSDPFYDEFNEINIEFNDQNNINSYSGLFFAKKTELSKHQLI
jgi:alpha-tubulin suppressor-like RCC1 family protein